MAAPGRPATGKNRLDELITCSICLDPLTEARTLACIHSFCTDCLKGIHLTFRREITCPLCKRPTPLPQQGVEGLPLDYRIEQIRDAIRTGFGEPSRETSPTSPPLPPAQLCDACKAQQGSVVGPAAAPPSAVAHCVDCFMWYCDTCIIKHSNSALFTNHSVLRSGESTNSSTVICPYHKLQAVKYVCKTCHTLLCTVCVMSHDSTHQMTAADPAAADQCRHRLKVELVVVGGWMNDIKKRIKCLETIKAHHQDALYTVESLIHRRANDIIEKVKEEEEALIRDARVKFDARLKDQGVIYMPELRFFASQLNTLCQEINIAIHQSNPAKCLVEYDDLAARIKKCKEEKEKVPTVGGSDVRCKRTYKFVSSSSNIDRVIGCLQECNIDADNPPGTSSTMEFSTPSDAEILTSPTDDGISGSLRKRTASILNALSPSRRDQKFRRIKMVSRRSSTSVLGSGTGENSGATAMITRILSQYDTATSRSGAGNEARTSSSSSSSASPAAASASRPSVDTADTSPVAGTSRSVAALLQTDSDSEMSSTSQPTNAMVALISPSSFSTTMIDAILERHHRKIANDFEKATSATNTANSTVAKTNLVASSVKSEATASVSSSTATATSSSLTSSISTSSSTFGAAALSRMLNKSNSLQSNPGVDCSALLSRLISSATADVGDTVWRRSSFDDLSMTGRWRAMRPSMTIVKDEERLLSPATGVAIMPANDNVVVAESEARLQVYSELRPTGALLHHIPNVHPHSVVVLNNDDIACTDRKDSCVKIYSPRNSYLNATNWGTGMFAKPSGVDFMSNGNLVVSDVEKRIVVVLSQPFEKVACIGPVGPCNTRYYDLAEPRYVAADRLNNRIIVSDVKNKCLLVFGTMGLLIRRITLPPTSGVSSAINFAQPAGLCVDQQQGNIVICDSANHKISLLSPDGKLIEHLLTSGNGLQYPYDVAINRNLKSIAVVESYFKPNEPPHNAVKLFCQP